jgi:hypothetical protein
LRVTNGRFGEKQNHFPIAREPRPVDWFTQAHFTGPICSGRIKLARGVISTVAARARKPNIGWTYGLPLYFTPIGVIDSVVDRTIDWPKADLFRDPRCDDATSVLLHCSRRRQIDEHV